MTSSSNNEGNNREGIPNPQNTSNNRTSSNYTTFNNFGSTHAQNILNNLRFPQSSSATQNPNQQNPSNQRTNNSNTSNYSIRIDNNFGDSNIFEFINNITGNLNMNIQFSNPQSQNRNHVRIINNNVDYSNNASYESEISEENSIVSLNLEESVDQQEEEEAYRQLLLQKRSEVIDELNVFQYKNVKKFVTRVEE
jgi:hypothetical protein